MYRTRSRSLIIISALIICAACDAPRKNPLDPNNPDRILLTISGTVQTISIPYVPVQNARILWQAGQVSSASNQDGMFTIETIQKRDDWLYIEKSGFFNDSVFISWSDTKDVRINVFLNSLTIADDLVVYSSVVNRYPNLQNEQLLVEAQISDRDEDIDSVFVANNYSGFQDHLLFNPSSQRYEQSFSVSDLNISQLEEVLGHPFKFIVTDKFNHDMILGQINLIRVIREEILFQSPSGNDSSSVQPTFIWQEYSPGFLHTYMIEIYTAEITPQLVWQMNNIPQDATQYQIDQALSPGEYFWVIWAIDEFGNRVQSKPASFRVVL
jgi:hypothetical protein